LVVNKRTDFPDGGGIVSIVRGTPIVAKHAIGRLHFLPRDFSQPRQDTRLSREAEWERFLRAQKLGVLELAGLYDRAVREVGESVASIFAIHAMLLEDEELTEMVRRRILDQGTSAEYAVWKTGTDVAASFRDLDDTYMKAREADILDIANRVLCGLSGGSREVEPEEPVVLVADFLLPSEVMEFNRDGKLAGVISRKGNPDSHTGHLLQAYNICSVVGAELEDIWEGHIALLDGCTGEICLDPDGQTVERIMKKAPAGAL